MLAESFVEADDGVEVRVTIEVRGSDRTELRATGYKEPIAVLGVTESELLSQAHATSNAVLGLHQNQGRRATSAGYQTEGDIRTEHTGFERVYADAVAKPCPVKGCVSHGLEHMHRDIRGNAI